MADIMSILQSSYTAASPNSPVLTGVEIRQCRSDEMARHLDRQGLQESAVHIRITKVSGFRANVTFRELRGPAGPQAFITTKNSFRIGDSSFTLTGNGTAKLATIVTDPNTGIQTANTAIATGKA